MYLLNNIYSISGLDTPLLKLVAKILLTHTREQIDWKRGLLSDVCICSETGVNLEHLSAVCRGKDMSGKPVAIRWRILRKRLFFPPPLSFLPSGFPDSRILCKSCLSSLLRIVSPKAFLFRCFWVSLNSTSCVSAQVISRAAASPVSAGSWASQIPARGLCFSVLSFKGNLKFRCLDTVAKADFRNIQ